MGAFVKFESPSSSELYISSYIFCSGRRGIYIGSQQLAKVDTTMAKMKGLLKGLRQISNIFEAADKEPEMQIGNPTDVKHVAHIGWDGPSSGNSPAWMNDLRSTTSTTPVIGTIDGSGNGVAISPQMSSRDMPTDHAASSSKELPAVPLPTPKPSRRNNASSMSTPHSSSDAAEGSRKGSRRGRRTGDQGSASRGSTESVSSSSSSSSSTMQDVPGALPKQPRPRKAKGTGTGTGSGEGSTSRSSRSKGAAVASDQGSEKPRVSPLKPVEEDSTGGK